MATSEMATTHNGSAIAAMAQRLKVDKRALTEAMKATVLAKEVTDAQLAAIAIVANEYGLNPLTREIHAFVGRGGGIVPIVGIDGWARIVNEHAQFNGVDFEEACDDKGRPISVTCRMYRKDRDKPIVVTEHFSECCRPTDPWKQWPHRMLRHKAYIQCARLAFGFGGIYDEDEGRAIVDAKTVQSSVVEADGERTASLESRLAAAQAEAAPTPEPDPEPQQVEDPAPQEALFDGAPQKEGAFT